MSHDPNCAIVRAGDLRAWCDCPHGGNRIPDSYLKKFLPKQEHEDLPYELRVFLDGIGNEKENR